MRQLTTTTDPATFIGSYGQTWRSGLISEHLDLFVRAGGTHRPSRGTGAGWAVVEGRAYPVLCSEIIRVVTEDGAQSGRCGIPANANGSCDAHDWSF